MLRIVEYEMTSNKKKTQQFILRGILFFKKDKGGNLIQLVQKAKDEETMEAEG